MLTNKRVVNLIVSSLYIIDSGMIGEVTSFYGALTRDVQLQGNFAQMPIKPGGGIAFDVGIYYVIALLSILGPIEHVTGIMKTHNPLRDYENVEHLGETFEIENENIASASIAFKNGPVGTLLFDSQSTFIIPEKPALVIHGTLGHIYMADPNHFGGDVHVILKGNSEPFTMPSVHPYEDESRGLGVAEMAWSILNQRENRASKEMAYHAIELLHGIDISCKTKCQYVLKSDFKIPEPLPRGYRGGIHFKDIEESALAL